MNEIDRRDLLGATGALILGSAATASAAPLPTDEAYWAKIASEYDVTREVIQFENGMWGMMPRPVIGRLSPPHRTGEQRQLLLRPPPL